MEACNITVNKNTVPGDTRPMVPGGVRIGTPAMTTRGLKEAEFEVVSDFLHRSVQITQSLAKQGTSPCTSTCLSGFLRDVPCVCRVSCVCVRDGVDAGGGNLKAFKEQVEKEKSGGEIARLRKEVIDFSGAFPLPS